MKRLAVFIFVLFLMPVLAHAQADEVRKKNFNIKKGIALEGYDPVSYFDGTPKEGKAGIDFTDKGIVYQFSSTTNRERFKAAPAMYEPAYGGWCAFAMGDSGEKVKIDPETYKIQGGKLYLFYNFWGNNTLTDWNKKENELKAKADQSWSKFLK